jgi:hypothetical protein
MNVLVHCMSYKYSNMVYIHVTALIITGGPGGGGTKN